MYFNGVQLDWANFNDRVRRLQAEGGFTPGAEADDKSEVEALERQIGELEQTYRQLEKRLALLLERRKAAAAFL